MSSNLFGCNNEPRDYSFSLQKGKKMVFIDYLSNNIFILLQPLLLYR